MRLTIVAGLIMGVSLAVHSALGAHAKAKVDHAARAVRAPVREVAPWYIALNEADLARESTRIESEGLIRSF